MTRGLALGLIAGTGLMTMIGTGLQAQQPAATGPNVAQIEKIKDNLDMNNGGSGLKIGDTLAKAAAGIKNVDTVITGHSTVMTWADLHEISDFNKAFLAAVQAAIKSGKTAEQALADLELPEKFSAYQMTGAKDNVPKIYAELGK